jgi:hypothetical protein
MQPDRDQNTPQNPIQPASPAPNPIPTAEPVRVPVVTLTPDANPPPQPSMGQNDQMTMSQPEPQDISPKQQPTTPEQEPLRWQANEYIHHEKDVMWFIAFGVVVAVLMAISVLVLRSITFSVLIPVMAVALIVYTRRPPRLIDYTLSPKGLYVNDQLYSFAEFKGFGVIRDGREFSIMLIPTKRFRLGVSVYFPEEAGEAIVDILGTRLPMQEMNLDLFDRIIHKLRI